MYFLFRANISCYAAAYLSSLPSRQASDAGDHFPVWGTCLGFQLLSYIVGGDVLSFVDAENYSIPLNLTSGETTSPPLLSVIIILPSLSLSPPSPPPPSSG